VGLLSSLKGLFGSSTAAVGGAAEAAGGMVEDVAEKIGTGRRAVMDAEKGKGSASAAVYTALLWAYDLLEPMNELADPALDEEGMSLSLSKDRTRARAKEGLDSDF